MSEDSISSVDAEMHVLGAMLSMKLYRDEFLAAITEDDFMFVNHKIIFLAILHTIELKHEVSIMSVSEELKRSNNFDKVGGFSFLMELSQSAGTVIHVDTYVDILRNKNKLRKLSSLADSIHYKVKKNPSCVNDYIAELQETLEGLTSCEDEHLNTLSAVFNKTIKIVGNEEDLKKRRDKYIKYGMNWVIRDGVKTGFRDIDHLVGCLGNSHFVILAARPSMGKTALAMNIAEHIAFNIGSKVLVFSLEMSSEQLSDRVLSSRSLISSNRITVGDLSNEDIKKVSKLREDEKNQNIIISDPSGISINELVNVAKKVKADHDIKIVIIDYLQLITGTNSFQAKSNRQNEVSEISRSLKGLSKSLNIPILCLAQLSRKVEERVGHKPLMSDLRESGSLEQDADVVMLMMRKAYYDTSDKSGTTDISIAKNRHGPTGDIKLKFENEFSKFIDYTPIERQIEDTSW